MHKLQWIIYGAGHHFIGWPLGIDDMAQVAIPRNKSVLITFEPVVMTTVTAI
jgi:hypothetical protein